MNGFGNDFKKDVLNAVKMESKRLGNLMRPENQEQLGGPLPTSTSSETADTFEQPGIPPQTSTTSETFETLQQPGNPPAILNTSETPKTMQQGNPAPSLIPKDKGCKIVFDNFDFQQKVHGMTEAHQNPDIHWVTHLAVENRVYENHLSTEKPSNEKLLSMENGSCLPNLRENHLQRENYISLVERVIVELPCLDPLKSYVVKHIPHEYSKEMAQKSKMVCTVE